jgi:hypothetical protein
MMKYTKYMFITPQTNILGLVGLDLNDVEFFLNFPTCTYPQILKKGAPKLPVSFFLGSNSAEIASRSI